MLDEHTLDLSAPMNRGFMGAEFGGRLGFSGSNPWPPLNQNNNIMEILEIPKKQTVTAMYFAKLEEMDKGEHRVIRLSAQDKWSYYAHLYGKQRNMEFRTTSDPDKFYEEMELNVTPIEGTAIIWRVR